MTDFDYQPTCAVCGTTNAHLNDDGQTICEPCGQKHGRCQCQPQPGQKNPRDPIAVALPVENWFGLLEVFRVLERNMDGLPQLALRTLIADIHEHMLDDDGVELIRWQWFQVRETLHMLADTTTLKAVSDWATSVSDDIATQVAGAADPDSEENPA